MNTLYLTQDYTIFYSIIVLFLGYLLIRYKEEFKADSLIDSFLYLTNKLVILYLLIVFLFVFIFSLLNPNNVKINEFLEENIRGLIYYIFINYSIYYGLKLINWSKEFYKKNDLFGISYFKKFNGENKK